jgi:hypothetical protein
MTEVLRKIFKETERQTKTERKNNKQKESERALSIFKIVFVMKVKVFLYFEIDKT